MADDEEMVVDVTAQVHMCRKCMGSSGNSCLLMAFAAEGAEPATVPPTKCPYDGCTCEWRIGEIQQAEFLEGVEP